MPDNGHFSQTSIRAAIAAKNFTEGRLHTSCLRIMSGWYALPADRRYPCGGGVCLADNVSTPEHKVLARKISAMSTVLLKNHGGLLPLDRTLKIVLIGADATNGSYTAGQGSGGVQDSNAAVSPLAAMQRLGLNVKFEPAATAVAAAKAAAAADVAILFGSAHSGEGSDRSSLLFDSSGVDSATKCRPNPCAGGLPFESVIAAVAAVQKKTVVVAAVPGQILTDWRDSVAAILVPFLPGEQYGNAIADVLLGVVPPQAKLPLTFPNT